MVIPSSPNCPSPSSPRPATTSSAPGRRRGPPRFRASRPPDLAHEDVAGRRLRQHADEPDLARVVLGDDSARRPGARHVRLQRCDVRAAPARRLCRGGARGAHGGCVMTAPPDESLSGRVALVTGGTRGIGAAICNDLARRGAAVAAGFSSNRERADAFLPSAAARRGGRERSPGQRGRPRGLRARRERGDRRARPPRHSRQQRRRDDGSPSVGDDRRRVAHGAARQPVGRLLHVQAGARAHARARVGPDHQHLVDHRRDRQRRPGQLRGLEGRSAGPDEDARPRSGAGGLEVRPRTTRSGSPSTP